MTRTTSSIETVLFLASFQLSVPKESSVLQFFALLEIYREMNNPANNDFNDFSYLDELRETISKF